MKQIVALPIVCCCIVWLSVSAAAHAAGDFVILGAGNAFWTNNLDAPICKRLIKLQPDHTFHSIGFAPHGDWVTVFGNGGYDTNNAKLPVHEKLVEVREGKGKFVCAAFSPGGGSSLLWNRNDNWSSAEIPYAAVKKLKEVAEKGSTIRSVAFGPGGAWVVLFGKTGIWCGNIPDELGKVFDNAIKKELTVRCVAFTSTGAWFCLTNNGWWTSDVNHPASKMIADLNRKGEDLHWIAVSPQIGPHDFHKFAAIVHEYCDGKLPAGYAFAVLHKGKVVAEGAHGWARMPWERQDPSVKWTLDKPMGLASVSKTITAVGLLKLWEESGKKFSLDSPFWPYIQSVCPQASASAQTVTIRQLLNHKSGFKKMDSYMNPKDLEQLLKQPLAYAAGTHSEYDNNNFYIARLVLEQIGHVQYTAYIKKHVLAPMGITQMETHYQAQQPTCGYGKLGSKRPGYPFDWDYVSKGGAAGWYASINDMCRFLVGLRDNVVLSPSTTEMMYKDLLGWDISEPGWEKNGGWFWDEGSNANSRGGAFLTSIYHFPDVVDAVMFINSDSDSLPEMILRQAWLGSM